MPNVCWGTKISKSDDPTFVGEQNFQNRTIQRLLRSKIFKIKRSNVCWGQKFSKSDDPTFVGNENFQNQTIQQMLGNKTEPRRVICEFRESEFWVSSPIAFTFS